MMFVPQPPGRRSTLALCTILHALTHAYGAVLVPLYLLMTHDLHLPGVQSAALIVSISGAVYFLLSYPAGMLADHANRKVLLGLGLIGNAVAILLMGLTHHYWALLALGVLAGVAGSLFHPAANALVAAHHPRGPGMALGLMGIGSGVGFFVGSQYSGWRAETVVSPWLGIAHWQVPCLELGAIGLLVAIFFFIFAREAASAPAGGQARSQPRSHTPMGPGMRRRVLTIAAVLGCRDFAGVATMTLVSIYLQKAHGFDAKRTGWILGAMGLVSIAATPISIWISPGRRRLPGLAAVIITGGLVLTAVPHVPLAWFLPVLTVFQVCHLSSYSMGEVAMVELVSPAIRGRVIGLFLTICGTLGAISPWVIGYWTDLLGDRATHPAGYILPFTLLGGLMILAAMAVRLMQNLRNVQARAAAPVTLLPAEAVA